jgi:hypothetical protein
LHQGGQANSCGYLAEVLHEVEVVPGQEPHQGSQATSCGCLVEAPPPYGVEEKSVQVLQQGTQVTSRGYSAEVPREVHVKPGQELHGESSKEKSTQPRAGRFNTMSSSSEHANVVYAQGQGASCSTGVNSADQRHAQDRGRQVEGWSMPISGLPVYRLGHCRPGQIKVGKKEVHPSHLLGFRQGFLFCWKCAAYGVSEPRGLGATCRNRLERNGAALIRRIERGQTPRADMAKWPLGIDALPPVAG